MMLVLKNCRVLDSDVWELTELTNVIIDGDEIKDITSLIPEDCTIMDLEKSCCTSQFN